MILLNTISSTLLTLDLQGVRLEPRLPLTVEWAKLVTGMRTQLSNLKTLTLRSTWEDEDTLMTGLWHQIGEELLERSLWEALEEHILHGARNLFHSGLLKDI